ncbi:MAG: PhzF family phenazine biosynthesis protein [Bacteroidota bacterium]
MKLPIYQADAFTSSVFGGNPAAVMPLESWLDDQTMQCIAMNNNLSETAFFVKEEDGYHLRWFTPSVEVDLCGHATLATSHVLFEHLGFQGDEITFHTKSGKLVVKKAGDFLEMDFPAYALEKVFAPSVLFQALGVTDGEVYKTDDYLVVLETEEQVANLTPDFRMLMEVDARGIIVTAPGREVDFVSRFFAPQSGIDEDPVTGSAHCALTPYWAGVLGKQELSARQISSRGGVLTCTLNGDRVTLKGEAITFLVGEITL